MPFSGHGLVADLLLLWVAIGVAHVARRLSPQLQRWAIPDAMVAGLVLLACGPGAAGLLAYDPASYELVVYHGLALVFVAVGLQAPPLGPRETNGAAASSFAFGLPLLAVVQGTAGLLVVIAWSMLVAPLHPGFGLLLPLGFQQGPGQALAIGQSWEPGFAQGGAIGLILAAVGFGWCVALGVPLAHLGPRLGLARGPTPRDTGASEDALSPTATPVTPAAPADLGGPGAAGPASLHIAAIAGVYGATLAVIAALAPSLAPAGAAKLWSLHFVIAGIVALALRAGVARARGPRRASGPLDETTLQRCSAVLVDGTTAASLAAVRVDVLSEWWLEILVITTAGGLVTTLVVVLAARRAFPAATLEHALVWYGTGTGTLPTGLALLRLVDPELRGPAARNAVLGATSAVVLGVPLLAIIDGPVLAWPGGAVAASAWTIAVLAVYGGGLVLGWWWLVGRRHRPRGPGADASP